MSKKDQSLVVMIVILIVTLVVGYSLGWTERDKAAIEWYEGTVIPGMEAEWQIHSQQRLEELNATWEAQFTEAEDAWGLAMGSSTRSAYESGYWDGLKASLEFNVTAKFPWIGE